MQSRTVRASRTRSAARSLRTRNANATHAVASSMMVIAGHIAMPAAYFAATGAAAFNIAASRSMPSLS